ncbi:MAG: 50S ribosomal protein L11 [Candidatus Diapherotrites archaeon]|nr:50S ribosomal protein L11 [Candidatus Diapherotrites archaeon]
MGELKVMVDGGKATAGAPLGPALGPTGVNIGQVVAKINEKTAAYTGMKVPIKVIINRDKSFEIEVGSPPISALIIKEAGAQKGAANPKADKMGNLTIAQLKKIAEMKWEKMNSYKMKSAVKEVAGSCDSMGITVEGMRAADAIKEIEKGKYDNLLE